MGLIARFNASHHAWRERTGSRLKTRRFHTAVIAVIVVDAILATVDVAFTIVNPACGREHWPPHWVEVLAEISFAIACVFMLELLVTVWALGPQWFNPFGHIPFSVLHLVDAVIIIATFVLELVLRGAGRELAALLVILRLWRLVKLVGSVAVASGDLSEERAEELHAAKQELARVKAELTLSQDECETLRKRTTKVDSPV